MCRYASSGPYKDRYACFVCRKAFKRRTPWGEPGTDDDGTESSDSSDSSDATSATERGVSSQVFALMAQPVQDCPGQRGLAHTKPARQRDHVARLHPDERQDGAQR